MRTSKIKENKYLTKHNSQVRGERAQFNEVDRASKMLFEKISPMDSKLNKDYRITHAWYTELLASYHRVSNEPTAEKLRFLPDEYRTIVEIGVYEGASSCWWSDNFLEHPESRLISIDPFTGNDEYRKNREKFPTLNDIEYIARSNIAKSKHPGKVTVMKGASWDLFPLVSRQLQAENRKIDILYIDGEHTAEAVCRDAALYVPLVRHHGAVIFDDFGNAEVSRGVEGALAAMRCIEKAFCPGWQLWCIKGTPTDVDGQAN